MKRRETSCGYSLLEVCIVIAVLGIIVLVAVMNVSGARMRASSRRCRGNLQALTLAVSDYAREHRLPPGALVHFTNIYPRFWPHATPGTCPATGAPYPMVYTNGVPVTCPSAAQYPDHVWTPGTTGW